jgi:hypothetical protein
MNHLRLNLEAHDNASCLVAFVPTPSRTTSPSLLLLSRRLQGDPPSHPQRPFTPLHSAFGIGNKALTSLSVKGPCPLSSDRRSCSVNVEGSHLPLGGVVDVLATRAAKVL